MTSQNILLNFIILLHYFMRCLCAVLQTLLFAMHV